MSLFQMDQGHTAKVGLLLQCSKLDSYFHFLIFVQIETDHTCNFNENQSQSKLHDRETETVNELPITTAFHYGKISYLDR